MRDGGVPAAWATLVVKSAIAALSSAVSVYSGLLSGEYTTVAVSPKEYLTVLPSSPNLAGRRRLDADGDLVWSDGAPSLCDWDAATSANPITISFRRLPRGSTRAGNRVHTMRSSKYLMPARPPSAPVAVRIYRHLSDPREAEFAGAAQPQRHARA
jgi:hypothetical protein